MERQTVHMHENSSEHTELLARVASLYYRQELTQSDIARKMDVSRSTVSRLLKEAREKKVVEFLVHRPLETNSELERAGTAQFELLWCRILRVLGESNAQLIGRVGKLAAQNLEEIIADDMIVGVSWGSGVYHAVRALQPGHSADITVVSLGGIGGRKNPLMDGPHVVRELANAYRADYHVLPVPLTVEDAYCRERLMEDREVAEVFSLVEQADVALVGIDSIAEEGLESKVPKRFDRDLIAKLRADGAVGCICASCYDVYGRPIGDELRQHVIAVGLQSLRQIGQVIAVAGEGSTASAILGALRGRYVDALVTDEVTAGSVLRLAGTSVAGGTSA